MYACKIKIDPNPQLIAENHDKQLCCCGDELTIEYLIELGLKPKDKFGICGDDSSGYTLTYTTYRLETELEVAERVNRAIKYNKGYDEFHRRNAK